MTIASGIALFFAMALSALIPGPSVFATISRSMGSGMKQGMLLALGILIADYIFIFLALSGLSALSKVLGEVSFVIKYVGIAYLFWLAYVTWTAEVLEDGESVPSQSSRFSSLLTGVVVGLSNPKAILFYMGFFPAFVDVTQISGLHVGVILLISTVGVGGVLGMYAYSAAKAGKVLKSKREKQILNKVSGGFMASCGAFLFAKS
ncbi:hypothetical protein D515_03556 [Grimontia indica]|uniref:Threonine efflux protein n=1 Tax=Grimontia indica TaxID=1056512 RepID=R1GNN7_9GAMM|nr:LysE family translocator [Grimontia indica]EOD77793.1 hypothetical protein D515_03556 [Grimontia indica]